MGEIKLKKRKGGLFTGGPAPTNWPSQRSRPGLPTPASTSLPALGHGRSTRARPCQASDAAWPACALADATTPGPPVDSTSALAILASTPCALSRSLSRSLASASRAPRHQSSSSSLCFVPDASPPPNVSFHLSELPIGFRVLGRAFFAQVSLPRGPNHSRRVRGLTGALRGVGAPGSLFLSPLLPR